MNDHDRFAPPEAEVRDIDVVRKAGSPFLGFLLGLVTYFGGTLVLGLVATLGYDAWQGTTTAIVARDPQDSSLDAFELVLEAIGLTVAMLAGYGCEQLARRRHLRLGSALGMTSAALMILAGGAEFDRPIYLCALSLLTVGATVFGTRLAIKTAA
ncbi:hypothetical protein BH10PSE17_BH10PSE17_31410 [soil metagenome]